MFKVGLGFWKWICSILRIHWNPLPELGTVQMWNYTIFGKIRKFHIFRSNMLNLNEYRHKCFFSSYPLVRFSNLKLEFKTIISRFEPSTQPLRFIISCHSVIHSAMEYKTLKFSYNVQWCVFRSSLSIVQMLTIRRGNGPDYWKECWVMRFQSKIINSFLEN